MLLLWKRRPAAWVCCGSGVSPLGFVVEAASRRLGSTQSRDGSATVPFKFPCGSESLKSGCEGFEFDDDQRQVIATAPGSGSGFFNEKFSGLTCRKR